MSGEIDTGVVQIDSLHLDAAETIRRAAAFYETLDDRARAEADLLRAHQISCVVADAPPLGCAAAAAAGIESIVISNFTWDWIYEGYADELRSAPELRDTLRRAYELAAAGWRLPMYGGFETIAPLLDLPFVARHARHAPEHVRRVCGLPPDGPLALLSFGGYGVRDVDREPAGLPPGGDGRADARWQRGSRGARRRRACLTSHTCMAPGFATKISSAPWTW